MSRPSRESLRYGTTVALGLVLDLVAARAALSWGAPLELAAALGVLFGAAFNYVLLGLWAFSGPKTAGPLARPLRYLTALGITIGARTTTVWVLQRVLPEGATSMLILCAAVVISFFVNFYLSKRWVFQRTGTPPRPLKE